MSKLTGKAKEDFYNWLEQKLWNDYDHFDLLHESMQWGVYVDFFDSVGLNIHTLYHPVVYWMFVIDPEHIEGFDYDTRTEARAAAIEKANEIYNE